MRVLLINAPFLSPSGKNLVIHNTFPPLGLLYLASFYREYGHHDVEFSFFDGLLHGLDACLDAFKRLGPDVVALTSLTCQADGAAELIRRMKKLEQQAFIVIGGVHATALPEDFLSRCPVDVVVRGEGEETFRRLLDCLAAGEDWRDLEGISFRINDKQADGFQHAPFREFIKDLDSIPFPDYGLIEDVRAYQGDLYGRNRSQGTFFGARGCPFDCVFCSNVVWKSSRPYLRFRSPRNVVDQMEWLSREFGIEELFNQQDEFNADVEWATEVCAEIKRRKLSVDWRCQIWPGRMEEALAEAMASAGCYLVNVGCESGNDEVIAAIGKRFSVDDVRRTCRMMKGAGVSVVLLLMLFNAWEEDGEFRCESVTQARNSLRFGKSMLKEGMADIMSWGPTMPYPGSRLYDIVKRHDRFRPGKDGRWSEWADFWNPVMDLPGISPLQFKLLRLRGAATIFGHSILNPLSNRSALASWTWRGLRSMFGGLLRG